MSLIKKLEALYNKAIHEATPIEEARTTALMLLKVSAENGVNIRFEVPGQASQGNVSGYPFAHAVRRAEEMRKVMNPIEMEAQWQELFRKKREQNRQKTVDFTEPEKEAVILHTKFRGVCEACCAPYVPGDRVWWKRGYTRVHEGCDPHQMRKTEGSGNGDAA